ncbi:MAG: replication factor C large subunit [Nanoarchaeota archaeon]|nr:replication factor C large subunit [Nanoarchaeota archaeon]
MTLFTTKYAPKNSSQVFGQEKAVAELKDYLTNYKNKKQRAALLYGPIGNGKTSSVYALAQELKYDLLEINSSDLRKAENIKIFLDNALGQQSLFFTPKLILIDEVDNISGRSDRGCIPALLKAIERSTFPVILTANDPYDQKMKALIKKCQMIEYEKLDYKTVSHVLQWVSEQEGLDCEIKAINSLARQVDGDLRGALIDLQSCSAKGSFVFDDVTKLSDRKRTESILKALSVVFKSSTVDNALRALDDVDLDVREVFLWMDENLPREYAVKDLAKAYEHLARADVFYGRIKRQQHWRFLVYIYNLLTAGVSSAKTDKNPLFIPYKRTMRLLKIWQANMKYAKRKEIASKLAAKTHTSKRVAMEQIPYFQAMFRKEVNPDLVHELDLTDEEVEWLRK